MSETHLGLIRGRTLLFKASVAFVTISRWYQSVTYTSTAEVVLVLVFLFVLFFHAPRKAAPFQDVHQ